MLAYRYNLITQFWCFYSLLFHLSGTQRQRQRRQRIIALVDDAAIVGGRFNFSIYITIVIRHQTFVCYKIKPIFRNLGTSQYFLFVDARFRLLIHVYSCLQTHYFSEKPHDLACQFIRIIVCKRIISRKNRTI